VLRANAACAAKQAGKRDIEKTSTKPDCGPIS